MGAASLYENNNTTDFTKLTKQDDSAYEAELHLIEKKILLRNVFQNNSLDKNIKKADEKIILGHSFLDGAEVQNLFEKKMSWQEPKGTLNYFYKDDFFSKSNENGFKLLRPNVKYVYEQNDFEHDTSIFYWVTDEIIDLQNNFSLAKIIRIFADLRDEHFDFILIILTILSLLSVFSSFLIHIKNR